MIDKSLLRLLREEPNRRCCDCNSNLADFNNIWVNVGVGCFVCANCKLVHKSLGMQCKSVNLDQWSDDEVLCITQMGNRKANELLERYVPSNWRKPTPESELHESEQWIKAKYIVKYFLIPSYEQDGGVLNYIQPEVMSSSLPMRLVDYFLVLGVGAFKMKDTSTMTKDTLVSDVMCSTECLNCFPDANSDFNCPFPEHICQFVFPTECRCSSEDILPTRFDFTLTNASGIKMHGVALHIHEEAQPSQLRSAVREMIANRSDSFQKMPCWLEEAQSDKSEGHSPIYLPKALVLLSHYPMYNVYSNFLQDLYHISLSDSPLPIERYISNFVCEVPLPPQGEVEVIFSLHNRTLSLKRPPPNQLPLADFSFRPLFSCLSVDNILNVIACLLCETQVALHSSHISILNPACEALLSLMFPLVWQGAYLPVMPDDLIDMLEAPVPFLVGLNSSCLEKIPADRMPHGIVFVNLDNNTVDLGWECYKGKMEKRVPYHMPDRPTSKLHQKLLEFGAVLNITDDQIGRHRCSSTWRKNLNMVDLAFPNSEHLLPIQNFVMEKGLRVSQQVKKAKIKQQLRIRRLGKKGKKISLDEPTNNANAHHTSMLDPGNNHASGFNVDEIRFAFLRFFVSLFKNYQTYIIVPTTENPFSTTFDRETFLRESSHFSSASHPFMTALTSSQMFECFLEERLENPKQPEILFFDESIMAKLNRSKTTITKKETPFLSSLEGRHCQTFSPPPPSHLGLPDNGCKYTYKSFPHLDKERYGNVRWAQRLFKTPGQRRNISSWNQRQMLMQHQINRPSSMLEQKQSVGTLKREECMEQGQIKVRMVLKGIEQVQALWKGYKVRTLCRSQTTAVRTSFSAWKTRSLHIKDRVLFQTHMRHVINVQRVWRGALVRMWIRRRHVAIITLQAWIRMILARKHLARFVQSAVAIQKSYRCHRCYLSFVLTKQAIVRCQSCVRGWLVRRLVSDELAVRLVSIRQHLFNLWKHSFVPLSYRFWVLFKEKGFLNVAIHEEEVIRLWRDLGILQPNDGPVKCRDLFQNTEELERILSNISAHDKISRKKFKPGSIRISSIKSISRGFSRGLLSKGSELTPDHKDLTGNKIGGGGASWGDEIRTNIEVDRACLKREMVYLYNELKRKGSGGTSSLTYFMRFNLENKKKRKATLVSLLWDEPESALKSAEVVLGILDGLSATQNAFIQMKRDIHIKSDLLCIVKALL